MGPRSLIRKVRAGAENLELVQRPLRRRAEARFDQLKPGAVTVVIVTWNSNQFLEVALAGVSRFADRETEILVVDNHSTHTPALLAGAYGARLLRLPANVRHGLALDIGFLSARTEFAMSLDVDAFPYRPDWMPTFLDPLATGFTIAGCEWFRPYAHPCCLAMRTADFVRGGHSFRAGPGPEGSWQDVGEALSRRVGPDRVTVVPKTGTLAGTGYASACYGDVVYHNCYGTRHLRLADPWAGVLDPTEGYAATRADALRLWDQALRRLGPTTWGPGGPPRPPTRVSKSRS